MTQYEDPEYFAPTYQNEFNWFLSLDAPNQNPEHKG